MKSSRSTRRASLALTTLVAIVGLVASHATLACSRSDGGDQTVSGSSSSSVAPQGAARSRTSSCDRVTGMSVCSEYSGSYLEGSEAILGAACAKLSGAFVGAECPNTSVLGSCTLATGEVRKFYASGGAAYDAARAEKECSGPYKGKWTALR
jgi:hypothetical protein